MSILTYYLRKKFWIKDFLQGSSMWKEFKDISYISNNKNITSVEVKRNNYLRAILKFAKSNTAFYKDIIGNELCDFPIINKQIIREHYEDFLVPEYKIPGQKGSLHIQQTSGSTGMPFAVPQDSHCRIRRIATIKVENEKIGFHSFEPMMHLRALKRHYNYKEDFYYNHYLNIIYVNNSDLTDEKIANILTLINKYKVKVIRGYMTTLDIITRYSVEHDIKLMHHPIFISVGELLLESLRLRIINELGCHIISQYGTEENGILGQSAIDQPGNTIYLNRANCYIEILKIDSNIPATKNELGRIVVTDFTNYALPMIRYDIGDIGMIGDVKNGILLSIKSLSGRKTDLIYTTSGKQIDLANSISTEICLNPNILQWQFIQVGKQNYILRLCLKDEIVRSMEYEFIESLKTLLGNDADIRIEYVDKTPILSSGKRKIIVQNYLK